MQQKHVFSLVMRTSNTFIVIHFYPPFLEILSPFMLSMTHIFLTFPSLGLCSYILSQPKIPAYPFISYCLIFKSFPSIKVQMKYHLILSLFTSPDGEMLSFFFWTLIVFLKESLFHSSSVCIPHVIVISIHDIFPGRHIPWEWFPFGWALDFHSTWQSVYSECSKKKKLLNE